MQEITACAWQESVTFATFAVLVHVVNQKTISVLATDHAAGLLSSVLSGVLS